MTQEEELFCHSWLEWNGHGGKAVLDIFEDRKKDKELLNEIIPEFSPEQKKEKDEYWHKRKVAEDSAREYSYELLRREDIKTRIDVEIAESKGQLLNRELYKLARQDNDLTVKLEAIKMMV